MKRANIIASLVLDLINQEFPKSSDFINYDDVQEYVMIFWAQVLQSHFKEYQKLSFRFGEEKVDIPDTWYKTKELKITSNYFKLPSYISFEGDNLNHGIKAITLNEHEGCACSDIILVPFNKRNTVKFIPKSDKNNYMYILGDKLFLTEKTCAIKSVQVMYIPGADDDSEDMDKEKQSIPESLAAETMTLTYNFLINGKNQTPIIDKTVNNNPNKTQTSEIVNS